MRVLCSSSDLSELTELVKRLLSLGIPCAVCKDGGNSQLTVWIQQDDDFPLALKIYVERKAPRPLPPWASLLDAPAPVAKECAVPATEEVAVPAADAKDGPCVVVVRTRGPTRTGSVEGVGEAGGPQARRPQRQGQGRHWGPRPEGCGLG